MKLVIPLNAPNVLTRRTVNLTRRILRGVVRDTTFIVTGRGKTCDTLNDPRQCPLVLLAKVGKMQVAEVESEEVKVVDSGLFIYAV
jgi:hypothetical protein